MTERAPGRTVGLNCIAGSLKHYFSLDCLSLIITLMKDQVNIKQTQALHVSDSVTLISLITESFRASLDWELPLGHLRNRGY